MTKKTLIFADTRPNSRRIRFTPPIEMFTVCHYTAPTLKQLPVTGRYEMKVSFIPIVLVKYIDYQVYIYLVKDNTI
jgi:hypothetical protein